MNTENTEETTDREKQKKNNRTYIDPEKKERKNGY